MQHQQPILPTIEWTVQQTPLIDTHEHLLEESRRLVPPSEEDYLYPCNDWSYLYHQYAANDLHSAGLSAEDATIIFSSQRDPREKWKLFEPYYRLTRNTAYCQAVEHTLRHLFDEDGIRADNVERITTKMRALVRKGYYYTVLRKVAKIRVCQVNSLEHCFCETEYPDLLKQDLSIISLCLPWLPNAHAADIEVGTLEDWYRVIDWYFEQYGPRAVAVKSQAAYWRRLNFQEVTADDAAPLFERYLSMNRADDQLQKRPPPMIGLTEAEQKAIEDHLFHYCVRKAIEYDLPIKLHCGYLAGANTMQLQQIRNHASDLCPILQTYPQAKFVLMHIGYPYQDEFISLAKHYRNVYLDMCWAWLINPQAGVRFLKETLMAAPAGKLFSFGGDYYAVETVPGHAWIARKGITQALSELVYEGWFNEEMALHAARLIMYENAQRVFEEKRF